MLIERPTTDGPDASQKKTLLTERLRERPAERIEGANQLVFCETRIPAFVQLKEPARVGEVVLFAGDPDRIRTDDLWLDRPIC